MKNFSRTVQLHYSRLIFRSSLFLVALILYVYNRIKNTSHTFSGFEDNAVFLFVIWAFFLMEIVLRFFPFSLESMGCQKQFKKNYIPTPRAEEFSPPSTFKSTLAVLVSWVALNSIFGLLNFFGILDDGIMVLIALLFSVCDIICILFFCPFQTWFMKNKCCGSCRIYNWDYMMMCTPLLFVENIFAQTLFLASLILLARWEITHLLHPERFCELTNASLSCVSCKEKLCHNKKQLRSFLKKRKFNLIGNTAFKNKK